MNIEKPIHDPVRFGSFELDLRAGELRKHGHLIRLQDQPFRLLQVLLEHSGELVTREELQRHIWPSDTFVDFDRGLNNAVKRLREALGDSAENPRFIERAKTSLPGSTPSPKRASDKALASLGHNLQNDKANHIYGNEL